MIYLSCADTAKLIRTALKESFPGVKFTVQSRVYAGGASIDVAYTNGPTYDQVKTVTSMFVGAYFDSSTDYRGSVYNSLDGEEVRFAANYVFISRKFSKIVLEILVDASCKYYGYATPAIVDSGFGAQISDQVDYETNRRMMDSVGKASACETHYSPTLARVAFLGDDGYGQGCVGRLAA